MVIGAILVVFGAGALLCVVFFGVSLFRVYTERAPVEAVLDRYMRYMAAKDAESAYALFSPRAQRQIPISKLHEMLEGKNYVVFEGYRSLSIEQINISMVANTNPDVPQGLVANVKGVILYADGFQGSFEATLEKVDGEWMIDGIFVVVPPEKIK